MFWLMKPAGVPDSVGGLAPIDFPEVVCMNRSGGTHIKGEVVALAFRPGVATEIATNDSNSYRPGASNDTVWNTVVDPITNMILLGGANKVATVFGVCQTDSVADNTKGSYKFFGLLEQAFVARVSGATVVPGMALTVTLTNSFTSVFATNSPAVATYLDISGTNTARRLRRVLLHNGMVPSPWGTAATT